MRLLHYKDLTSRGIPYSRQWLDQLIKAGKFPRPVKLGTRRIAWVEAEIDQHLKAFVDQRDGVAK
jgi:prophage regulatory protein